MAGPTIVSVTPASGASGVPVNTTITAIFDQEVDLYRLKNGGIFLSGPDQSKSIGPGFLSLDPPQTDEDDFLTSPGYAGIEDDAELTFQRVDGSGESVNYYDYGDTANAGQIYRTKVTLTPARPLAALTQYTVHIVGDEDTSDAYDFGLSTRSVYDPRKGANLGNGEALFYGGYTGSSRVQFFVEMSSAGVSGVAEYEWWTSVDTVHRSATTSNSYRLLEEGVRVRFPNGLNYSTGDTFSVWCDVPVFMDGSSIWSFTTSDQSPTTLPVSSSTLSGSGSGTTSTSTSLSVSSTSPEDRAALVSTDLTTITVTFGAALDASTVTSSAVTVEGEAVDGSVDGSIPFTEVLTVSRGVSGAVLTLTLDSDEIYTNNLIVTTLDSTIADTSGNTLGSDYCFFFGVTLSPFYAGIRSVRLRLGALGNSFPDETVAMAIWSASKMADAYTPATIGFPTVFSEAREQFVICYAAYLLIAGGSSIFGGGVRKRLGDFDVSRSDGGPNAGGLDDVLKECWESWLAIIIAGGDIEAGRNGRTPVMEPLNVVKGDDDPDTPHFGRLWEIPRTPIGNARVLYSGERRWYKTHVRNRRR
jgi:hypothetical protein